MVVYDSGLASFEPGTQSEQVQDANYKVHFVSNPPTRLVCDNRSKGYIFSHPDRQETQKITQVRFRGQTLPVLCSSVLAPRMFTKCIDAALAPLRLQGFRILNYLDDWLILTQSQDQTLRHRDLVLNHLQTWDYV